MLESELVIGIGLPVAEIVNPTVYYNHISVIAGWNKRFKLQIIGLARSKITKARNVITETAMNSGCTHLLFIDSDHIIPENMLPFFVENSDAAMVSGLIYKRKYPYDQVAFKFDSEKNLKNAIVPDNMVVDVDACAMGCTLINLGRLRSLNKPYFTDGHYRHDLSLCLKFKYETSGRILIDSRVHIGHVGDPEIVYPENAYLLRKRCDETRFSTTEIIPQGGV